jgi:glycosyltransferase involved in cell wall biosynthesis
MSSKTFWIINQTAGSAYHGMVYRNYYIAKEWVNQGHRAIIISSSFFHNFTKYPETKGLFTRELIDGIEYWWVKMPRYSQSRSLGRLFSIFLFPIMLLLFPFWRLAKPDTIIVSGPPHLPIINAWLWSRIYYSTLVYEIRDIWPLTIQKLGGISSWHPLIVVLSFFERIAYLLADRVVSVLSLAHRHCIPRGMLAAKFAYVPNGIDLSNYSIQENETGRKIADISKNKFTILYAGSFGIANHLDQLMKVARSLKNEADIAFVLIGSGPHKSKLQEEARDLSNVHFFSHVPKEQIPFILKQADVGFIGFVKTDLYQFGVSPNKIFDYMAAELPILMVLDSEDDIIERAKAGLTIRSDETQAINEGILNLKNLDEKDLRQLGLNGRSFLEENHTYEKLAKRYVGIAEAGRKPLETAARWAFSPFWVGFYFVLIAGLIFHLILPELFPSKFRDGMTVFLDDPHSYHRWAMELADLSWRDWWNASTHVPSRIMSFIYRVTGIERPFMFLPVLAALAGLTIRLQAAILDILGVKGRWWPLMIAVAFTVTPTSFSWMIYPHKDAFIIPGILMLVWVLLAASVRRPRFRHILAVALGLWLFLGDKSYFAQIMAAGVLLGMPFGILRQKTMLSRMGTASLFLTVLMSLLAVSHFGSNYGVGVENANQTKLPTDQVAELPRHQAAAATWQGFGGSRILDVPFQRMIYTRERFLFQRPHGDTNFMPEHRINSSWDALAFFPRAMQLVLVEPGPWHSKWDQGLARGGVFFALQLEMGLFYFLLIFLILSGRNILRTEVLICLFIALPFLVALGYSVPNIGAINRYRFPFLLLIKLAGFSALWASSRTSWPGRLLMWVDPPEMKRAKRRLVFLVPDDITFIVQRLVMAKAALNGGYEVHVLSSDTGHVEKLESYGFIHHRLDLHRGGLNPVADFGSFVRLIFLLAKIRPDILHNVSIKPVIYGSTAGTIVGLKRIVNLVNGLGYAFSRKGFKGELVHFAAVMMYRNALALPGLRVIFQNPDNRQYFLDHKLVDADKTVLIRGSGVDMKKFVKTPLPQTEVPTILYVGRLLWSKGIRELVKAAEILRAKNIPFNLVIVGEPDELNPESANPAVIKEWEDKGLLKWMGRQSDMPKFYQQADIVCLPSNYGEGLPLTMLEAAATGRPLVTTDVPGCREVIKDNGFLVPPLDAQRLADVLEKLLIDREMRERFGEASYQMVKEEFSSVIVEEKLLAVYRSLLVEPVRT